jgi:hypothetical protein
MSERDLDARLRALFADADTAPGFEARVMARIAARHTATDAKLLLLAERHREAIRLRLRREAWMNVGTAAGIGAALIALVWREGPAVVRWVEQGLAAASDLGSFGTFAFVSLGIGAWVALQRLLPR